MVLGYGELLLPWFAANAPKSKEQGYLTYNDINDALPEGVSSDDLDEIYA